MDEYLKAPEVLRIARSRAYKLVASGGSPAVEIGRSVRMLEKQRCLDVTQR